MAIVCQCEVVRDRDIVAAIEAGACSIDDVRIACGAVNGCGDCAPAVVELLRRNGVAVAEMVRSGGSELDRCGFASTGTA